MEMHINYVGTLANNEDVKASFKERIKEEAEPQAKKKLQAMMEYFDQMEMKNGYIDLKKDREYALQSMFDEDDIMRTQGQDGITSRTEEIAERLQEKLDERDHVDEEPAPEEEIREKEEQKEEDGKDGVIQNPSSENELR